MRQPVRLRRSLGAFHTHILPSSDGGHKVVDRTTPTTCRAGVNLLAFKLSADEEQLEGLLKREHDTLVRDLVGEGDARCQRAICDYFQSARINIPPLPKQYRLGSNHVVWLERRIADPVSLNDRPPSRHPDVLSSLASEFFIEAVVMRRLFVRFKSTDWDTLRVVSGTIDRDWCQLNFSSSML